MTISTEEKAVNILANQAKGNMSLMLKFEEFQHRYEGAIAALVATEGNQGDVFVSDEQAYNEYEHIVHPDPDSEYLNVFNHESKL